MTSQTTPIPQPVQEFLADLIRRAGLEQDTPDKRYTMIDQLYTALNNYLTSVAVEKLSEVDREEFVEFVKSGPASEQMSTFLRSRIVDAEAVFTDAMEQFESIYLAGAKHGRVV